MDKYLAYTALLQRYISEKDETKKQSLRYELILLMAEFKPIFKEN